MSFATITLCVASQRVFIVVSVYFVIDSVRKLLDTPSYCINLRSILRVSKFVTAHTHLLSKLITSIYK
jgi:hypothetical protein